MSTLRTVPLAGNLWLVCDTNDKRHWLHPQGKVGDCIRPGQKMLPR